MSVTLKFLDRYADGNPRLREAPEALLARLTAAWRVSEGNAYLERLARLYAMVDTELAAVKAQFQAPIPCAQGCSHCCKFDEILVSNGRRSL